MPEHRTYALGEKTRNLGLRPAGVGAKEQLVSAHPKGEETEVLRAIRNIELRLPEKVIKKEFVVGKDEEGEPVTAMAQLMTSPLIRKGEKDEENRRVFIFKFDDGRLIGEFVNGIQHPVISSRAFSFTPGGWIYDKLSPDFKAHMNAKKHSIRLVTSKDRERTAGEVKLHKTLVEELKKAKSFEQDFHSRDLKPENVEEILDHFLSKKMEKRKAFYPRAVEEAIASFFRKYDEVFKNNVEQGLNQRVKEHEFVGASVYARKEFNRFLEQTKNLPSEKEHFDSILGNALKARNEFDEKVSRGLGTELKARLDEPYLRQRATSYMDLWMEIKFKLPTENELPQIVSMASLHYSVFGEASNRLKLKGGEESSRKLEEVVQSKLRDSINSDGWRQRQKNEWESLVGSVVKAYER